MSFDVAFSRASNAKGCHGRAKLKKQVSQALPAMSILAFCAAAGSRIFLFFFSGFSKFLGPESQVHGRARDESAPRFPPGNSRFRPAGVSPLLFLFFKRSPNSGPSYKEIAFGSGFGEKRGPGKAKSGERERETLVEMKFFGGFRCRVSFIYDFVVGCVSGCDILREFVAANRLIYSSITRFIEEENKKVLLE